MTKINSMKNRRTCPEGHVFFKTSDCNSCPVCEEQRRPPEGFLSLLSAPARRALEQKGISTPEGLAAFTQQEILSLHGIGPASIPLLKATLESHGLDFQKPAK